MNDMGSSMLKMTRAGGLSTVLLSGSMLMCAAPVWAQSAAASEDARIARLEAAVATLQAQVQAQSGLAAENAALKDRVSQLQARVTDLTVMTGRPIAAEPAVKPKGPVVLTTFNNGEVGLATADNKFSLTLSGLVQLDTGFYDQRAPGPVAGDLRRSGPALGFTAANVDAAHARQLKDGDNFRRGRFGVSGTLFRDFQYRGVYDFGGSGVENSGQLYEAWGQYNGLRPLHIRIGAFAPLQGLADQDSTAAQPLLERAASADVARNFAAGDTRTAAQVFGYGDHWLASVAVTGRAIGVVNTSLTGTAQTFGDPLAFVGRLAATPLHGADWRVHVGVHGQYLDRPANVSGPAASGLTPISGRTVAFSDQAELRIDGTRLINTGNIDARHAANEGVEFAAQWRGFLVQSEYDHFDVQRAAVGVSNPRFQGYYVEGSWLVTGETRRYNNATAAFDAPTVRRPLGANGGFGAMELTVRYSDMNLNYHTGAAGSAPFADSVRGGELQVWTAGLNWYLNSYVRLALEGQHVKLDRLSPDAFTYGTPVGAQIGQSYNAVALRSQFGF